MNHNKTAEKAKTNNLQIISTNQWLKKDNLVENHQRLK